MFAALKTHAWAYPALEVVHIVGIALLLGNLVLFELRVWGFAAELPVQALARLALRHEVIAVRLSDPLEHELPDIGMLLLQDAESGEQLFVDTHDGAFRKRFADLAEAREQELRDSFAHAGVDALELSTDSELLDALLRFAELRELRGRATSGGGMPAHLEARTRQTVEAGTS